MAVVQPPRACRRGRGCASPDGTRAPAARVTSPGVARWAPDATHKGMHIRENEWDALVEDLVKSLDKFKVPGQEMGELLGILGPMKPDIVGQQLTASTSAVARTTTAAAARQLQSEAPAGARAFATR